MEIDMKKTYSTSCTLPKAQAKILQRKALTLIISYLSSRSLLEHSKKKRKYCSVRACIHTYIRTTMQNNMQSSSYINQQTITFTPHTQYTSAPKMLQSWNYSTRIQGLPEFIDLTLHLCTTVFLINFHSTEIVSLKLHDENEQHHLNAFERERVTERQTQQRQQAKTKEST